MFNLRTERKLYNDFYQPNILHKYRPFQKFTKKIQNFDSRNKLILLEKLSSHMSLPVYIKCAKKINNDYSQSLENKNFTYYNLSNNNINMTNLSTTNRNSIISELRPSIIRMSNISVGNNYTKYRNEYEINKIKKFLNNSYQEINEIQNNDLINNKFLNISLSHSSKKEKFKKPKNIENNTINEIEVNENSSNDEISNKNNDNFNNSIHKMRYLLSKNFCGKRPTKGKYMNRSTFSKIPEIKRVNTNNNFKSKDSINKLDYPKKTNSFRLDINWNNIKNKINMEEKKFKNNNNIEDIPQNSSNIKKKNKYQINLKKKIINELIYKNQTTNGNLLNTIFIPNEQQNYSKNNNNNINNIIKEKNQLNINNIFLNKDNNFLNSKIEIELEDLILIEGKLNDIMIVLENKKNIFVISAINETSEYFIFYFNSTLKDKFPLFFNLQNRIIIQSAFNLNLFIILLTYHLSTNTSILIKSLIILKNIYELLKLNLYLFIRKIEIYYGDDYCQKNDIYFKNFNYFMEENNINNLNEKEIIEIITKNCIEIINNIENILNYYKTTNNEYYIEFQDIYLNISILTEQDICNYFFNNIYNNSDKKQNKLFQPKNNIFLNNEKNIENDNILLQNQDNNENLNSIIISFKKNKKIPPFIRLKNKKKYTLVLDLEDTLVNIKFDNEGNLICYQRPGLIPFLNGLKPFYEIISFTKLSKIHSNRIIEEIQGKRKLFDYNLYRDHCFLSGTKFIKDISRIGRDMKKIIIVDDSPENLETQVENGILISPYNREDRDDKVLYELKKILTSFFRFGYEDLREAIKNSKGEIYNKITLGNIFH